MRNKTAGLAIVGLMLTVAYGAEAQVDKEKLKKKAEDKQAEGKHDLKKNDLKDKANSKRDEIDDDDGGSHAGAIVGGVAAAAIVGTVVAKTKGGDGDKAAETTLSFGSMDRNKDGKLARDEFQTAMSKGFQSADKNGDNTLTRAEAVDAYGERGGKYFDALDDDKAGSITMDSLEADANQAFAWADKNDDGSVTADERTTATAENAEAEKQQKAHPGKKAKLLKKVL
jgi:Ca2+-binding EF-hand superfamily protein